MLQSISIIIVLYKGNLKDYAFNIDKTINIIVVDNTPNRNLNLTRDNLFYIPLQKNVGIARALNIGFSKAKEFYSKWVLTMDQDSDLPPNMLMSFLNFLNKCNGRIGLVSPQINMFVGENHVANNSILEIKEALTSGSFIKMDAYDCANGFKDEMFIDAVDFEFCRNIRNKGYKIYRICSVVMQHQLGDSYEVRLFGKHLFYITNHNYIRHYYMQRNSMYLDSLYKVHESFLKTLKAILKIIFFERDKYRKLKARYYGWKDFKNNKFGEFNYNL